MAETDTAVKPEEAAAAPPAEPGLGPAGPEAAPEGAPEAVGSDAPPEGAPPEPTWWAAVEDEDGLRGHETVSGWLKEAREEGAATARSDMQPRLDARNARQREIQKGLDTFWQSFNGLATSIKERASDDGGDELKAVNELLKVNQPAVSALAGSHYDSGRREAFLGHTYTNEQGEPAREMGVLEALFGDPKLADPFVQRAQNAFEFGTRDTSFYDDLRKALTKTEVEATLAKERAKLEKDIRAQVEAEDQAKKREEKGNPPVPTGGGGGGAGGVTWRTKQDARNLHAKNLISNAEMNRIKADPNIPD